MTQGPCNHYLMLQQSFQLFTTEDSRATWNNSLLDKLLSSPDQSLKQLKPMEEDSLCCSHFGRPAREYLHGIHLYLREQEYSHFPLEALTLKIKSAFPSYKKPPPIKMCIFVTLANVLHYFFASCSRAIVLIILQALKNIWNEIHDFPEAGVDSRAECLLLYKDLLIIIEKISWCLRGWYFLYSTVRVSFSWTSFQNPLFLKIFLS